MQGTMQTYLPLAIEINARSAIHLPVHDLVIVLAMVPIDATQLIARA